MVRLSAILICCLSNFAGNSIGTELEQAPSNNNNDAKLIRKTIIPLSHGAGNTQPSIPSQPPALQPINPHQVISAAGKPGAPQMATGFQSHFGQAKSIQPNGFRMPMAVHQGFRPVMKAEGPPVPPPPPPPQAADGDGKPKGDIPAPPPGPPPPEQNNEHRDTPPPPPPPSGSHNFQNISPSIAPNDFCRNSCKMNEGMTFVYCYQDCTHDPNWLLVPEDVESASLPTNLLQPSENKQTTNNGNNNNNNNNNNNSNNQNSNNNSTDSSQGSATASSKKPKATPYNSDRTQYILTMDSNSIALSSSLCNLRLLVALLATSIIIH